VLASKPGIPKALFVTGWSVDPLGQNKGRGLGQGKALVSVSI
jgi:hypothetical protein